MKNINMKWVIVSILAVAPTAAFAHGMMSAHSGTSHSYSESGCMSGGMMTDMSDEDIAAMQAMMVNRHHTNGHYHSMHNQSMSADEMKSMLNGMSEEDRATMQKMMEHM